MTFFSLFVIGLSYGSTACMFACMPFLTPLLVSNAESVRESMTVILPFSLGRIFTYSAIAVLALSGAGFVKALLDDNALFQLILGAFTLAMGLFMLFRVVYKKKNACASNAGIPKSRKESLLGLFGIGALVSVNPCAPVLTLVALSANSGSVLNAVGMGISFGVGAVLVPFLFYGFFLSNVVRGLLVEFKAYTKSIEIAAALLLTTVGILIVNGQIRL
ncbi:MAG: sulfite exporter TauE/SafE family protein [Helicobacteraceae bacterium]|jgi:cytochrome c-type biogenesis protein|nr:sulfite exporter TauE/SafE family protein [Helicobacteraceae bacterium]